MIFYRRGRRERRGDMGFLPQRAQRGTCFFTAEDAESAEGIWGFYRRELRGGMIFYRRGRRERRGDMGFLPQ